MNIFLSKKVVCRQFGSKMTDKTPVNELSRAYFVYLLSRTLAYSVCIAHIAFTAMHHIYITKLQKTKSLMNSHLDPEYDHIPCAKSTIN